MKSEIRLILRMCIKTYINNLLIPFLKKKQFADTFQLEKEHNLYQRDGDNFSKKLIEDTKKFVLQDQLV